MGDTIDEIINLFILDIYYSFLESKENNKKNIAKVNFSTSIKLFSKALLHNIVDNNDLILIEMITNKLKLIFGIKEEILINYIYNLFTDTNTLNVNVKLIEILRKSNIKLVAL